MELNVTSKPFHLALLTFACKNYMLGLYVFLSLFCVYMYEREKEVCFRF